MQTVDAALTAARKRLISCDSPALDARLLLQAASGLTHAEVIADPHHLLDATEVAKLEAMLARRAAGEPVSRILGQREFYGRAFAVTSAVLDPRPDTECLINAALHLLPDNRPLHILDLGTGSGIIAITLLAERLQAKGCAIDVSEDALAVAAENARLNQVQDRLSFQLGHWFEGVKGTFDAIVSNPPYIETSAIENLSLEVRNHDPHISLDGGADGLTCYREIAAGAAAHLKPRGFVAVEIGQGQEAEISQIFARHGFALASRHRDLGGHIRCLVFHHDKKA
jgi:release factor glutamine methyltransferase